MTRPAYPTAEYVRSSWVERTGFLYAVMCVTVTVGLAVWFTMLGAPVRTAAALIGSGVLLSVLPLAVALLSRKRRLRRAEERAAFLASVEVEVARQ